MTPKSLLRNKLSVSSIADFEKNTEFQPIIITNAEHSSKIKKLLICSGKVYYDLFEAIEKSGRKDIAIIRIEQFYPFPEEELMAIFKKFKKVPEIVYCQEEPQNMGAWLFVRYRLRMMLNTLHMNQRVKYFGRTESASTAAGYSKMHNAEQNRFIQEAIS